MALHLIELHLDQEFKIKAKGGAQPESRQVGHVDERGAESGGGPVRGQRGL